MPSIQSERVEVIVLGNVAFDVICYPVDDVQRYTSMTFDRAVISPGGCGSNTAIGLAALGIETALIAGIGDDLPGDLAMQYWSAFHVNTRHIQRFPQSQTGVSIGLVDHQGQPRFVHTTGSNQHITLEHIPVATMIAAKISCFHIAGFYLMPGILDPKLGHILKTLRANGILTTLDVQQTERLSSPKLLWNILGNLDIFMCNLQEAHQMSGAKNEIEAASDLLAKGANTVIIKLGERGCYLAQTGLRQYFPAAPADTLDTTGAGDAFAAGLIAAMIMGNDLQTACLHANAAGAAMVSHLGAVEAWKHYNPK